MSPTEALAPDIIDWIEDPKDSIENKLQFLGKFSVRNSESIIIQLRKYLIHQLNDFNSRIDILNIHELLNTLLWLSTRDDYNLDIERDIHKIDLIIKIILKLYKDEQIDNNNVPVPIFNRNINNIKISSCDDVHIISEDDLELKPSEEFNLFIENTQMKISYHFFKYPIYYDFINGLNNIEKLEIKKTFNIENSRELANQTYNNWKESVNIRLYECYEMNYDLKIHNYIVGSNVTLFEECEFIQDNHLLKIYYSNSISLNRLVELSKDYPNEHMYNLHLKLTEYKNNFDNFNRSILDAIENSGLAPF